MTTSNTELDTGIDDELLGELSPADTGADALDDLLEESIGANPLDDLDSLLDESLQLRNEAAAIANARERLKRQNIDITERRETEALIRSWEARRVWLTVANVTVWEHHVCDNCGHEHKSFSHVMHKQTHRDNGKTIRIVKADAWADGVPNLVALQEMTTPMCPDCAEEFGLDITKGEVEWTNG
jgi:hypothetical protein